MWNYYLFFPLLLFSFMLCTTNTQIVRYWDLKFPPKLCTYSYILGQPDDGTSERNMLLNWCWNKIICCVWILLWIYCLELNGDNRLKIVYISCVSQRKYFVTEMNHSENITYQVNMWQLCDKSMIACIKFNSPHCNQNYVYSLLFIYKNQKKSILQ